jgi:hypothetical protein
MRGHKAIAQWAKALGPHARALAAGATTRVYLVLSQFAIRDCLVRIEAGALDRALAAWNQAGASADRALTINGKAVKNAIDEEGHQTDILSATGHDTASCYAQKKSSASR